MTPGSLPGGNTHVRERESTWPSPSIWETNLAADLLEGVEGSQPRLAGDVALPVDDDDGLVAPLGVHGVARRQPEGDGDDGDEGRDLVLHALAPMK